MYAVVTKDGNVAEFEHEVQARMYADVTGGAWAERRVVSVPMSGWKWVKAYSERAFSVKEYRLKKLKDGRYVWRVHDVLVQKDTLKRIRAAEHANCRGGALHMRPAISVFDHN